MNSKAVALFLSLGLSATLAACGGADTGGEEGGTTTTEPTPTEQGGEEGGTTTTEPTPTEQGGEEGGDSSVLPSDLNEVESAQSGETSISNWVASESGESGDRS